MKRIIPFLVLAMVLLAAVAVRTHADGAAKHYVCPPCNAPCDAKVFDQPGICPGCGMALVEQAEAVKQAAALAQSQKKVAFLVFNGCEVIDYTGPYEVFGAAGCDVYTVGKTKDPITTAMGMTVVPKYSFADAPQPDVLLIPGGGVKATVDDAAVRDWIRQKSEHTTITMSVCNGAFILAKAGMLDGLNATTTDHNIPLLTKEYPAVHVVSDQRWTDNGHIVTTAGLSAGIDGALHVVSRLLSEGVAQQVALGEEYDWKPEGGFVRGALAERLIPQVSLDPAGQWDVARTQGSKDRWELVLRGRSALAADELYKRVADAMVAQASWSHVSGDATRSAWSLHEADGRAWSGEVRIEAGGGGPHTYTVTLEINRAS